MKSKPRFSIITVCYNVKEDLEKTIKSVSDQSFKEYEYIVIDGGSTDGTKELLRKYNEDITYWASEPDKGIYNAMNKGAKVARGEYLYFLNVKDTFSNENVLEEVNREIDNNQDLVYGRIRVVNKENKRSYIRDKKLSKFNVKLGNKVSQQAVFIRKDTFNSVEGLDERYKIAADFDLLCKIFDGNYLIKRMDLIVCNYDGGGVSSNLKKSYGDTALVIKNRYNGLFTFLYKINILLKVFVHSIFEFKLKEKSNG